MILSGLLHWISGGQPDKKLFEDYCCFSSSMTNKLSDEFPFPCGFTCNTEIHDYIEPRSFQADSANSQWQNAMIEETQALQAPGTWCLVPLPSSLLKHGIKSVECYWCVYLR
ncbi:uncharacterized protein LOC133739714 [Rosa rugosa]|uniref:uncharacterized protein LOC133739714 n=1 Tax=Rosa rugosa TaxID=74645 RepID=UPI002B4103C3|nr:uncharacterized protein LOC133739714 [Rosa rugosa]